MVLLGDWRIVKNFLHLQSEFLISERVWPPWALVPIVKSHFLEHREKILCFCFISEYFFFLPRSYPDNQILDSHLCPNLPWSSMEVQTLFCLQCCRLLFYQNYSFSPFFNWFKNISFTTEIYNETILTIIINSLIEKFLQICL